MRSLVLITAVPLALCLAFTPTAEGKKGKKKKGSRLELPKKKLKLGKLAETQKSAARENLDAAIRLVRGDELGDASCQLYDYVQKGDDFQDEARYNLAKALYRMGLNHSALGYFAELLSKGPQNRYYRSSLEWCLFLSRKMLHNEAVNEVVAQYSNADFPAEYRDEFLFRLARFHYTRALAIESGAVAGKLGETKVKETVTGGKSFEGDLFGGEGDSDDAPPTEDEPKVKKKEGGGLSIDSDLFGEEEPASKPKKKEEKKEKKPGKGGTFALTAKEHMESAARLVVRVDPASGWGPRAKFLEALVLYRQGKDNEALEAFKAVVRATKSEQPQANERLRELAFFQLARTHFGAKQPSFSIFYYGKVDRDSFSWLDALYEGGWAEFRLGNYEKALGNLLTLHSPFFREDYYPESQVLKAVIYYENCRYPEAKDFLTDFLKQYEPVHEELKKLTSRNLPPDEYYQVLENLRGDDLAETDSTKATTMSQILTIALGDDDLKRLDASYREVDTELKSFAAQGGQFASCSLSSQLEDRLNVVRAELGRDAGRAVKRKLDQERSNIKNLIQQAIRIDIETSRAEQERIESQLRDVQSKPKNVEKEFIEWSDDEKYVWPFIGEYWRDELGTYELTLSHTCETEGAR